MKYAHLIAAELDSELTLNGGVRLEDSAGEREE